MVQTFSHLWRHLLLRAMFVTLALLPFSQFHHSTVCLEVAHGLLFLVCSSCRQLCWTSKYHTVSLSSGLLCIWIITICLHDLLTDNADNDLKEHQEEEGILEPFLSKSSRSSVMDANIAGEIVLLNSRRCNERIYVEVAATSSSLQTGSALSQEKGLISRLRTYEINEVPSYRKSLLLDIMETMSRAMLTGIFWVSSGHSYQLF